MADVTSTRSTDAGASGPQARARGRGWHGEATFSGQLPKKEMMDEDTDMNRCVFPVTGRDTVVVASSHCAPVLGVNMVGMCGSMLYRCLLITPLHAWAAGGDAIRRRRVGFHLELTRLFFFASHFQSIGFRRDSGLRVNGPRRQHWVLVYEIRMFFSFSTMSQRADRAALWHRRSEKRRKQRDRRAHIR